MQVAAALNGCENGSLNKIEGTRKKSQHELYELMKPMPFRRICH